MLRFDFASYRLHGGWRLTQPRPVVPARWLYSGDVNLEHGGVYIDISTWRWGYCAAVRVTDLASARGFDGAVLIERVTINGTDDSERIRRAVASCGDYARVAYQRPLRASPASIKNALRFMLAEALLLYGHFDPDDGTYDLPASCTVQTTADGPMVFDGWRAAERLSPSEDLFTYVVENYLQD